MVAVLISPLMDRSLYSVRMRASSGGRHLAGAERIVAGSGVGKITADLTQRAMSCSQGDADEIQCIVERLDPTTVRYAALPDLSSTQVEDWRKGRHIALCLLVRAGVQEIIAARAINLLANGAGPGGLVMRGAVIMDAVTGERLEPDQARGIRVSRMDLLPEFRPVLEQKLRTAGLGHHRVLEALILSGKVLGGPGIVAELCWSDDPDYTTGYVADPQAGYQRITNLKPVGDSHGGRIFFVNRAVATPARLIDYLQCQPVLFTAAGSFSSPKVWSESDE
jgi:6-carboxyhexanoate--CoA ligase